MFLEFTIVIAGRRNATSERHKRIAADPFQSNGVVLVVGIFLSFAFRFWCIFSVGEAAAGQKITTFR
jgi:hypothetical protein